MDRHSNVEILRLRHRAVIWTTASVLLVAAGLAGLAPAHAAAGGDDRRQSGATPVVGAAAGGSARDATSASDHRQGSPALDRRVALLSRELDLDPAQQARVRMVLENQAAQVSHVWNDESVPAAVRVKLTQDIGDRTAAQIRGLLNDEQRKKYSRPIDRNALRHDQRPDIEAWMQGRKTM